MFVNDHRPDLIVGESLLPAVIPMLRTLGVEESVKKHSTYKPGATIVLSPDMEASFNFSLAKTDNQYAYNVPRNKFDEILLKAAIDSGVEIFHAAGDIQEVTDFENVRLSDRAIRATNDYFGGVIDFIIDASGRKRLFQKKMDLPSTGGERKDLALFAHHKGVKLSSKGNIHVDRLEKGWAWRIPLPQKVSVGIVTSPEHLVSYGNGRIEQYENFLKDDPFLRPLTSNSNRISDVLSYTNYQWQSEKLFGKNWALVGDAAGFIDPVFSTGLFLAMDGAFRLATTFSSDIHATLEKYEREWLNELMAWTSIIDTWYDGRLLSLFEMGQKRRNTVVGKLINRHVTKHVTRIFTGEINYRSYSHKLMNFMTSYAINSKASEALRIR